MKREERGQRLVASYECSLKVGLDLLLPKHSNKTTANLQQLGVGQSSSLLQLHELIVGYNLSIPFITKTLADTDR